MNTRARIKAVPVLLGASLGLTQAGLASKLFAHEGHVAASLQPQGLPELNLTIEESGVVGVPASVEAGRYLVKVTGTPSSDGMSTGILIAQLPEGITPEQALDEVMNAQDAPPSWYLETTFAGGVSLNNGTEGWSIIDLQPGSWVVTTLYGSTLAVEFEVTGEFPADVADVEANVTLDLVEMSILISDGEFVAGENIVHVVNKGAQLHFVDIGKVPDGTTHEQVEALLESFMTGTPPPADGLQESDFAPLAYIPEISGGVSISVPLTLEPGTYFLACWVPDLESGMPHSMMGMWELVTVA